MIRGSFPPPQEWEEWRECDPLLWPRRVERRYALVPTGCTDCAPGCGLLAWVDKDALQIRRFEGNPLHPASRGRSCPAGPAAINRIHDPERILHPLRRSGERGAGGWERVSWARALEAIAARVRRAFEEGRRGEVRLDADARPTRARQRLLHAWGLAQAPAGGVDPVGADYARARVILLLPTPSGRQGVIDSGRILDGARRGAELAVIDARLTDAASRAQHWLPAYPGSEAALLLAIARLLLEEGRADLAALEVRTNWRELASRDSGEPRFASFLGELKQRLAEFTLERAEAESGVGRERIARLARSVAACRGDLACGPCGGDGDRGGWQVARARLLLSVLTGSAGTGPLQGGFRPGFWHGPAAAADAAEHAGSFLLPRRLEEGSERLDVYFSASNPVGTQPDGMSWVEALRDPERVGLHVALASTWSETATFADLVLPMGQAGERHDVQGCVDVAGGWVGFQQPVLRALRERRGERFEATWEANPGEVWEEDELWIELSWRVDPDGHLGVRGGFESPYRPGEKLRVEEDYRWIFENCVPGLQEAAAAAGTTPLELMRRRGVFELAAAPSDAARSGNDEIEIVSTALRDAGWPEHALPGFVRSHVHRDELDASRGELALVAGVSAPTAVHPESGDAKYLNEISHANPVWIHTGDADRLGIRSGDLVRVKTAIGYFVNRAWVTEGVAPGVVACSRLAGRWRLHAGEGSRWSAAAVRLERKGEGWLLRQVERLKPFRSADPDSRHLWWRDAGVAHNLALPVQPDPVMGGNCWHQKVVVSRAGSEHRYGDVFVDTRRTREVYRDGRALASPAGAAPLPPAEEPPTRDGGNGT